VAERADAEEALAEAARKLGRSLFRPRHHAVEHAHRRAAVVVGRLQQEGRDGRDEHRLGDAPVPVPVR
jgi:hypothetical protein